ncbi:MAG: ABC transporter ATP-binding protein [Planctomycetota bacterium]
MADALRTTGLVKRYGKRRVVDGVSLSVREGEIYGFLGPNGSGKTTTIRMVLGLISATEGSAELLGRDVAKWGPKSREGVGGFVESPTFYPYMSGYLNLRTYADLSGGASDGEVFEALRLVGLLGRENDLVRTYSFGMKQRLGIAQALLPQPRLLILDEPSLGLDPHGMVEVREMIQRLHREKGLTILFSTHLLAEVQMICTRVGILQLGKLLFEGPIDQLVRSGRAWRVKPDRAERAREVLSGLASVSAVGVEDGFLTFESDAEAVPDVNRALVEAGVRVFEIGPGAKTLEDVFLKMTKDAPKVL